MQADTLNKVFRPDAVRGENYIKQGNHNNFSILEIARGGIMTLMNTVVHTEQLCHVVGWSNVHDINDDRLRLPRQEVDIVVHHSEENACSDAYYRKYHLEQQLLTSCSVGHAEARTTMASSRHLSAVPLNRIPGFK